MKKRMRSIYYLKSIKLKSVLSQARHITICLDGWSMAGLSASFIGISACFFNPETHKPVHAFLSLKQLPHPHTGVRIADCLDETLTFWKINASRVLHVVSDNGANIMKAIHLLQEKYQASLHFSMFMQSKCILTC